MRNVDLTGKLGLEGKPTITIGDTVLTINDEATNMLRVLKMLNDGFSVEGMFEAATLLFDAQSGKALKKLGLSLGDYAEVVSTAVDLVIGGDSPKAGTRDTTS